MGGSYPVVVFFDGICNLCNGAVQFIIRHDPDAQFTFAPLQSEIARTYLEVDKIPDSIVLYEHGNVYTRSDAALRIARRLKGPWRLLRLLRIFPRSLRDWFYDRIAFNRYRWFGRRDACMVPTPELRDRFLPTSSSDAV